MVSTNCNFISSIFRKPPGPPAKAPPNGVGTRFYSEFTIDISSRVFFPAMPECSTFTDRGTELSISNLPSNASYITIEVGPSPGGYDSSKTVIVSSKLAPNSSLSWRRSDLTPPQLGTRPSSFLLVKAFDAGRPHTTLVREIRVPLAELMAGYTGVARQFTYQARTQDSSILTQLDITLTFSRFPGISTSNSDNAELRLPDLRQRKNFSDAFSYEVGHTLDGLAGFVHTYEDEVPPQLQTFLYATMSVFWRITERQNYTTSGSSARNSADVSAQRNINTPYGRFYPLRDIIFQMNNLLRLLTRTPLQKSDDSARLLREVSTELCRCIAVLEANIQTYRDVTWEKVNLSGQAEYYRGRQETLFFLTFKSTLLLDRRMWYVEPFDRDKVVQQLLKLAIEEDLDRKRIVAAGRVQEDSITRPFTSVLASARGGECDRVWSIVYRLLREELDAARRDVYRRVLIRLVQAADRIPDSLWLQIHSLRKNAGALSGAFATVYRGRTVDDEVAIKVPQALISLPDDVSTRREVYLEIVSWKTINHANLLPFLGVSRVADEGRLIGEMCMISPYMDHGTLKSRCGPSTNTETRLQYIAEVVEGMEYLHGENLVHGDLHTMNIFVDAHGHVQIADFGLSVLAQGFSKNYFSMRTGNVRWAAPELVAPRKYGRLLPSEHEKLPSPPTGTIFTARPTKQSDVFTFSRLCFELYSGMQPYDGLDDAVILEAIHHATPLPLTRPSNSSDDVWGLVEQCGNVTAASRPSFHAVGKRLKEIRERSKSRRDR